MNIDIFFKIQCVYRTESLVQYFPLLGFLNFIFNFILSCFFLNLKVYANEAERKQRRHERFAYTTSLIFDSACKKGTDVLEMILEYEIEV